MKGRVFLAAALLAWLALPSAACAQTAGLEARQYKVGLDPAAVPRDPEAAIAAVRQRLAPVQALTFKKPKPMQVQFFDTRDCSLSKAAMLLRVRGRPGKAQQVTLKVRSRDILAVGTMPLDLAKGGEIEFEDDYGIGPDNRPDSDFSRSLSYEGSAPRTMGELGQAVANLGTVVPLPADTPLQPGALIAATVYSSKSWQIADGRKIHVETTFWYAASDGTPLSGDISFKLRAPFTYGTLQAADKLLQDMAGALGPLKAGSAEKARAVMPAACR